MRHLEENRADQCAYGKSHCTYDNLCRLVQDVMIAKCQKKKSAAVFLDVEEAFDKVSLMA